MEMLGYLRLEVSFRGDGEVIMRIGESHKAGDVGLGWSPMEASLLPQGKFACLFLSQ